MVEEEVMVKGTDTVVTVMATGTVMEANEVEIKVHMAAVAGATKAKQPLKSETKPCSRTLLETRPTMLARLSSTCSRCRPRSKVTTNQVVVRLTTMPTMPTTTDIRAMEQEWINTTLSNSTTHKELVSMAPTRRVVMLMQTISSSTLTSMASNTTPDTTTGSNSSQELISMDRSKQAEPTVRALKQHRMARPRIKVATRVRSEIE